MTDRPMDIEGNWLDKDARLSLFRQWLNPLEIMPEVLLDGALWEQGAVISMAEQALEKILYVEPSDDPDFASRAAAADLALNSFTIQFGSGLNARIGLILRLIFDRAKKGILLAMLASPRSEVAAMVAPLKQRASIHPHYADLLGIRIGPPKEQLAWWINNVPLNPGGESFETRNGFRYGHLFILLHEMSHIALHHFDGEEAAMALADPPDRTLLRLGFESQADLYALFNLIVYIDCCVEAEAASEFGPPDVELTPERRRSRDIFVVSARGSELRAAFFGIFAVMSCFSPMRWTNLDFEDEEYLQPTTRLGLAVKMLDLLDVPFDGRPAFVCFDFINEVTAAEQSWAKSESRMFTSGPPRKWNWSDFLSAAISDWDMEVTRFLNDMRIAHNLPMSPVPFAIHGSGLEFGRQTFQRYKDADELAERFQRGDGLFISSEGYFRHLSSKFSVPVTKPPPD